MLILSLSIKTRCDFTKPKKQVSQHVGQSQDSKSTPEIKSTGIIRNITMKV